MLRDLFTRLKYVLVIRRYKRETRELLMRALGIRDEDMRGYDKLWKEYALNHKGEPEFLLRLIWSGSKRHEKARALAILLVPALTFSPFKWYESRARNYLAGWPLEMKSLEKDKVLVGVAGALIMQNLNLLSEIGRRRPAVYNRHIQQLMKMDPSAVWQGYMVHMYDPGPQGEYTRLAEDKEIKESIKDYMAVKAGPPKKRPRLAS